jgi:hypothetical protein
MQIGDRARDKGTLFVGTIIQFDPPTSPTRALLQADDVKGGKPNQDRKVGDPPPEKMWQRIEELELIDRQGNAVSGSPGSQLDASGHRLDSAAHAAGASGTVDGQGRRVDASGALIDNAGNRIDAAGNLLDVRAQPGAPGVAGAPLTTGAPLP